jgi:undecaprenyldiphospho-muramoylpentapeptide beta-N-acetylglucosaminyltransferase
MSSETQYKGVAMITTGGTGGHVFPGIAVARALQSYGWDVFWLGTESGMEAKLVPEAGISFESIRFGGVRGKGLRTMIFGSLELLRAFWQSRKILKRRHPHVVIGFGGFASFPGAFMAIAGRIPVAIHEANAVPGLANRILKHGADQIFVGFPGVLGEGQSPHVLWSGNPVRDEMLQQAPPQERFASRSGPLRILVVGGSLGARVINEYIPVTLAMMPEEVRPRVIHQTGEKQISVVRSLYADYQVGATFMPFIDEMGSAYAEADFVICRGGAMTIAELSAVGVGALIVPLAGAIADEQSANADMLVKADAAIKIKQSDLTPRVLATQLANISREHAQTMAENAYHLRKENATETIAQICMSLGNVYRNRHSPQGVPDEA